MTRTYEKFHGRIESFVYDKNKLVLHCIYYLPTGYGYPRYHFENFALYQQPLNYEICRFMKAVAKIIASPQLSLETFDAYMNEPLSDF